MALRQGLFVFKTAIVSIVVCLIAFVSLANAQNNYPSQVPVTGSTNRYPVTGGQAQTNLQTNQNQSQNSTTQQQYPAQSNSRQGYYQQSKRPKNNMNQKPVGQTINQRAPNSQNSRQQYNSQQRQPAATNSQRQINGAAQKANTPLPKPFVLSANEQQYIDQILVAWEKRSDKVKKFECTFKRWQYDKDSGAKDKQNQDIAISISQGDIKYYNPDKGLFKVKKTYIWNRRSKKYQEKANPSNEHWVTNGMSVFEFNGLTKQMIQRQLPPELQGKAIIDGPLPFLFGAKAEKLKKRFYMRERTDPRYRNKEIWLEAYPRWQRDYANFRRVQLIMTRKDFMPYAMRVYLPDGRKYTVYEFNDQVINSIFLSKKTFQRPKLPGRDWRLVVEKMPATKQPSKMLRK